MLQLESQMDELNSSITNMQKNQADLAVKMDMLSVNLATFNENLKDFGNQVSRLSSKIDDVEVAMGQKVSALGQTIKKEQEEVAATLLPSKMYQDAYLNLTKKNYEMAAEGFRLYLEKFPKGEMTESAYYNLGEAYAGDSKWEDAALAYATVLDKFKNSPQTPAVRLRYAGAILNMPGNHKEEAERYLDSIIQDFPDSPQSKLAQNQLKELKGEKKPAKKPAVSQKKIQPVNNKKQTTK